MRTLSKILLGIAVLFGTVSSATADTYVHGYYRRNGTYVQPHYRSDANATKADNWSTRGNVNPYTGQIGTRTYSDYNNYGYMRQHGMSGTANNNYQQDYYKAGSW